MGKSPKQGGSAPQQASYGGQAMPQSDAQAKYQADLAAWRAPTTVGKASTIPSVAQPADIGGVPQLPTHYMGDPRAGPAIPKPGVLPTAPVPIQRNSLARLMQPTGYGTAWSPYSSNSSGGGGYTSRSGPTFSSFTRR